MSTEVQLPTGGRAWISARLTHGQMAAVSAAFTRRQAGEIDDFAFQAEMIRALTLRSAGVTDPEGEAIELPADLERMDYGDSQALSTAITAAFTATKDVVRPFVLPSESGPPPEPSRDEPVAI